MNRILTPEEMAALLEGLKETEGGRQTAPHAAIQEIRPRVRSLSERPKIAGFQHLSNWLMVMTDFRWPHLLGD